MSTYVVSTTGSDSGTGSLANPWATFLHASNLMADGDLLYVRGGTYDEAMLNRFPSGISSTLKTRIVGYAGDSVPVIAPSTATSANWCLRVTTKTDQSYEGLHFNGLEANIDTVKLTDSSARIDLINCEVSNAPLNGVLMTGTGSGHLLRGCTIHHNGLAYASEVNALHNIYVSVPDVIIETSDIYDAVDPTGFGIHAFGGDPSRLNVRRCRVYDNGDVGIGIFTGSGMRVENCLAWGNGYAGIRVSYSASGATVYHNTCYGAAGIVVEAAATGTVVKNNIAWWTSDGNFILRIDGAGNDAIVENNISNSIRNDSGGTATVSGNLTSDPLLVNAASDDFHLSGLSPAIAAGTDVGVETDIENNFRQSNAITLGAYQRPVYRTGYRVRRPATGHSFRPTWNVLRS